MGETVSFGGVTWFLDGDFILLPNPHGRAFVLPLRKGGK